MAKKESKKGAPLPKPAPITAPPLNRTALLVSVAAYVLWLLFLLAVATGLIR